jgi:hypothetical protein
MINKSAFFYNGGHALVLKALITMTQNRFKTTLTIIYLAQGNVIINYSLFLAKYMPTVIVRPLPAKQIKYLRNLELDIFMKRT